jgi:hypothetical protein
MLVNSSLDPNSGQSDICARTKAVMRIGRTILALFISISVAMLPGAGSIATSAKSSEMTLSASEEMDMSASEDMCDRCPDHAKPCDKSMGDCGLMATCALKCFPLSIADGSPVVFPSITAKLVPSLASRSYRPLSGNPPFRPPRV